MTYRIGGQVVDQGSGVSGQPVFVVDTGDANPSNWTVEAATTTNADGSWSVVVSSGDLERYHAVTQFEDAGTLKNAESKPFVTGQPVVRPVEIPIRFNIPAPQTIGTTIPDSELFEHNDLTGEYGGDTGAFDIQTDTATEGSYALALNGGDTNNAIVRQTTDKWERYGIEITYQVYAEAGSSGGLIVANGVNGHTNASFYESHINTDNYIELRRYDNGSLAKQSGLFGSGISTGVWLPASTKFYSNGDVEFSIDGDTASFNDETYDDVLLGFHTYATVLFMDAINFQAI
jgi:hypothetical protein